MPQGIAAALNAQRAPTALQVALARGRRWLRQIKGGQARPGQISAAPTLGRSAVVYGANASGKSNLIKALQYMRGVVTASATAIQPGQTFAAQPSRLDGACASQPSEFEVTFLLDSARARTRHWNSAT